MAELPARVREIIEAAVGSVRQWHRVTGGDVSRAARVDTDTGAVFAKWGASPAGDTYVAEADGLARLAAAVDETGADLVVPTPLAVQAPHTDRPGMLVLPWIEPGRPTAPDWRRFGVALAALHGADAGAEYGRDADNWIGSKPQRNGLYTSWPAFFGQRRLLAQAETVRQRGAWDSAWDAPLGRLVTRLGEILPPTPHPSVLHGDLWAGNALATADGRFALVDPAVYVGHRETDLAMTELFGGFDSAFYDGYREAWPLEPGYPERREIYNLFHLTNHLTHGPGYRQPVETTLRRFGT